MKNEKLDKHVDKNHSYFYSIELQDINCFKTMQTLDLSDGKGSFSPWTVILGDNGTGKTTLLKVLDRVQPSDFEIDFKKYNVDIKDKCFLSNYSFVGIDNNFDAISLEELGDISVKIYINGQIEEIHFGQYDNSKSLFYNEKQGNMFIISYGATRRMSKSQSLRTSSSKYISSLFNDEIELINAEEWFLQKEWAALKSTEQVKIKFEQEFNLIKNILIDFLPDVEDIVSKTIDQNNSKAKIEVKTSFGWVNIRDLSFGYQTITALLVDIASNMMNKYPKSQNPLAEPVIILIDEIDLHLHPKWQRTVIEKLSYYFPKAQFIVTAHSPLIVQAAEDFNANIIVCRKEEDSVVIDNKTESVKGWRVDQILTSDLFELKNPRSTVTQELVEEYIFLKGKEKLSKKDIKKMERLTPSVEKAYNARNELSELDERLQNFAEKFLK